MASGRKAESGSGVRDTALRCVVWSGAAIVVVTEVCSTFGLLRRFVVLPVLAILGLCLGLYARRSLAPLTARRFRVVFRDPVALVCLAVTAAILVLTFLTALGSPPNSADAMAYHMPRVVYWVQQGSVRFFPTPYLNQIMLQPFAEYCILHLFLLAGNDALANLVQWSASAAAVVGVSSLSQQLGANVRGQMLASFVCATLPSGILASSGAKNDYVLAAALVLFLYFLILLVRSGRTADAAFAGSALGLALLTKATAYLFAPFLLLVVVRQKRRGEWPGRLALLVFAVCAAAPNVPHYLRNYELSGSPLGFDSAHGDGRFRWRNETYGVRQTFSNALRHLSEQMGGRSEAWNQAVYRWALRIHEAAGLDPNDPGTTWYWAQFEAPRNANHEANAANRTHLLLFSALTLFVFLRALRGKDVDWLLYAIALLLGAAAFCFYLKWQPYSARFFLPLFVLACPLASLPGRFDFRARGVRLLHTGLLVLIVVLLADRAKRPALDNWTRPLRGSRSVWVVPRERQYFADMVQWGSPDTYLRAVRLLAEGGCDVIGVDINEFPLEYPLQALLRQSKPEARFEHIRVSNVSRRYASPAGATPCALVCLKCNGGERRNEPYRDFPPPVYAGDFGVYQ